MFAASSCSECKTPSFILVEATSYWLALAIAVAGVYNVVLISARCLCVVVAGVSFALLKKLLGISYVLFPLLSAAAIFISQPYCALYLVVLFCCFLPGCEGERRYRTLISLLGSVSPHAPSGYPAGRGANPAGGAQVVVRVSQ
ncbi:ankyrin repeats-containing protein [Dorcoceras hygrometricum]|uniref:Ankyrin repeats-containing protein n=1 Tax=Dorcoceras hygrometricum TaxID=472368 RepID=A0A2Z7C603_9LAMI|nr:ankyrin repeats-containing protein [Dorcoceras hygrometricum]